jgi:magnesium chelatase subunit I
VPALRHRLRRDPLETTDAGERVAQALEKVLATSAEER